MKKRHYTNRQYRLAAGLVLALGAPAIAQVPPLNLPGLPPPPGVSNPATGSSNATGVPPLMIPVPGKSAVSEPKKETNVSKSFNPTDMLPQQMLKDAGVGDEDEKETETAKDTEDKKEDGADTANTDTDKKDDTPQTAGTTDTKPTDTANEDGPPPPPLPFGGLPTGTASLPPPTGVAVPPLASGTGGEMQGPNLPSDLDLTLNPEDNKPRKSWETTLAPSRTYPKTKFNYKRVVLPASIYRTQYNAPNRHLPKRLAREDLDKDFLKAVARNDINGTRALLNSGRNVNQMNAYGDSALIVAVRAGAYDTARLLVARGANTNFYGQGGKTAFHYARQQGNTELAKILIKGNS